MSTRLGQQTGIDNMVAAPPAEFKRMCQNFGPDLGAFVSSWEDLAQHALIGIDQADALVIRAFLDRLLSAGLSDRLICGAVRGLAAFQVGNLLMIAQAVAVWRRLHQVV